MTKSTLRSSSAVSNGNNGHWIEEDRAEFEESKRWGSARNGDVPEQKSTVMEKITKNYKGIIIGHNKGQMASQKCASRKSE